MKLRPRSGNRRNPLSPREPVRHRSEAWTAAYRLLAIGAALVTAPLQSDAAGPHAREAISGVRTLRVPWARPSSKHAVFVALSGGRIQVFDLVPLYDALLKRQAPRRPQRIDLRLPDVSIRFYPITNEAYCFQFRPTEGAGESWAEAMLPGSAWQRVRTRFEADRYFYFFWVASDSFETFRNLRDSVKTEHVDVEWKPVRPATPLEICQGTDGTSGLEPQ